MAVAVQSPFVLNIVTSGVDIPQCGGTLVAGRRRRINNDPYGGDGYVWEDIPIQHVQEPVNDIEEFQNPDEGFAEHDQRLAAERLSGQRSVATERLDQVKQHLMDIIQPRRPAVEGFSLDNIHLDMGGIQDWHSPQLNCPRYTTIYPRNPAFQQDWQNYAREVLFRPQQPRIPMVQQCQHLNASGTHPLDPSRRTDLLPKLPIEAESLQSRGSDISFEPLDVTCSSWSSLMAHRRRQIAEIA